MARLMRSRPGDIACLLLFLAVQVCCTSLLPGQTPAQPGKPAPQHEAVVPSAEEKRKALEADTERLVKLAEQLKTDLEHTRQDELSMKVLREAEEIDRLARSTRTRVH